MNELKKIVVSDVTRFRDDSAENIINILGFVNGDIVLSYVDGEPVIQIDDGIGLKAAKVGQYIVKKEDGEIEIIDPTDTVIVVKSK